MERTWKPTTAGILTIIGGIVAIAFGAVFSTVGTAFLYGIPGLELMAGVGGGIVAIGVISLIGGIMALKRKSWVFALIGAILAVFPVIPLGILAIIFVSMGKNEFK